MAEEVGFARNINIEWLNAVAECKLRGDTREEAADKLNALIGESIKSKDNIRKTRTILLRIWYDADDVATGVAEQEFRNADAAGKLAIHWAMILMEYPVFADLCNVIGHMFDLRDEISTALIQEKMYEKWGERGTLLHSISKNIQTLKDIGAMKPCNKAGLYTYEKYTLTSGRVGALLIYAALKVLNKKYMGWFGLSECSLLYPFSFENLTEADVAAYDFLELNRFDGNMVFCVSEA